MSKKEKKESLEYFAGSSKITIPSKRKYILSRIAFPLLALLSREQSEKLGLTPIDDERVIMALKHTRGKLLDIGCGANNFVKSYGNGVGVDVESWKGADVVIDDASKLPFKAGSFDTVSYLACLNHIPNRTASVVEANRVLKKDGQLIITMIPPTLGRFIHWLRFHNDPDHKERHINHDDELMGMSDAHIKAILTEAGFKKVSRKRFVYGMNAIYIATK